jgi:hypothetical protein
VIWSACETGPITRDYALRVLDAAAAEGVWGVELCNGSVDRFIAFDALPQLASAVDAERLARNQSRLDAIAARAAELGLRLGLWHHEVSGPRDLLERMPELRADDGLIDLEGPYLYAFIRSRLAEFFRRFPTVDELVLTLTETAFAVAHRPFCDLPPAERIRRVLQAAADVTDAMGKQLVVRPFSAIRDDELNVRKALKALDAEDVSVMYKTEPFDWHPFLDNEELIGSVPRYEARAETDCGAEYYGQTVFPACYTRHLERRLRAALDKGAAVAVLRVDRGAEHAALGHPINEANILPVTRWLARPDKPLADHVVGWLEQTCGTASPELADLLEGTFEVIRRALYVDQQAISHCRFPTLEMAKHIQVFALFEPDVPLDHMSRNWGVIPTRRTVPHDRILREKAEAVELAGGLVERFDRIAAGMPAARRGPIRESLARLEVLARSCLQLCRLIAAHTAEMWGLDDRTDGFEAEARRLTELAEEVARRYGDPFFPARPARRGVEASMPAAMRGFVEGLTAERELQRPLRQANEAPDVVDYVLCGFATEGHRLAKRLVGETFVRQTGAGPDEGFTVALDARADGPLAVEVVLVDDGTGRPGVARIGDAEHRFDPGPLDGPRRLTFEAAPDGPELPVSVWSTTPAPCRISLIRLVRADAPGRENGHRTPQQGRR